MKITKNNLCLSVSRLFLSVWGRGSIKICMSLHAHRFDCERACVRARARARVCVCWGGGGGEDVEKNQNSMREDVKRVYCLNALYWYGE